MLQSCVLLGGGLLCIGTIFAAEQFDFSGMLDVAANENKFHVFNMTGGIDSSVFWVVILGGFFIQLVPFTSDQAIAQRFLTTHDEKSAARSVWAHAVIVVPASLLFFGLGTALYVYYASRPEMLPPADVTNDIIVPWFIATRLPAGIAGLVTAGLFAATMSTVDSGMHSVATSLVNDVHRKLRPDADDRQRLRMARILTVAAGLFGTISAVPTGRIGRVGLDRVLFRTQQAAVVLDKHLQNIFRVWFLAAHMYGYSSIYVDYAVDCRRNTVRTVDRIVHSVNQRGPGEIHLLHLLIRLHGTFVNISGHVLAARHFTTPGVPSDTMPSTVTLHVNKEKRKLFFVFSLDGFQTPRLEVERWSCGARQRDGDRLSAAEAGEPDRIVPDHPSLDAFVVLSYAEHGQIKVRRLNAWLELDA